MSTTTMTPARASAVLPTLVAMGEKLRELVKAADESLHAAQSLAAELGMQVTEFVETCPSPTVAGLYDSAKLAIQPKSTQSRYDMAADLLRGLFPGEDPRRYLVADAFAEPHRVVIGREMEEHQAALIMARIKDRLKDEIRHDILNP